MRSRSGCSSTCPGRSPTRRSRSVVTSRDHEPDMPRIDGVRRVSRLVALGGLDVEGVRRLATAETADAVDAVALQARTGGNPLFVRELVRSPDGGGVISDVLERSLERFDDDTRALLAHRGGRGLGHAARSARPGHRLHDGGGRRASRPRRARRRPRRGDAPRRALPPCVVRRGRRAAPRHARCARPARDGVGHREHARGAGVCRRAPAARRRGDRDGRRGGRRRLQGRRGARGRRSAGTRRRAPSRRARGRRRVSRPARAASERGPRPGERPARARRPRSRAEPLPRGRRAGPRVFRPPHAREGRGWGRSVGHRVRARPSARAPFGRRTRRAPAPGAAPPGRPARAPHDRRRCRRRCHRPGPCVGGRGGRRGPGDRRPHPHRPGAHQPDEVGEESRRGRRRHRRGRRGRSSRRARGSIRSCAPRAPAPRRPLPQSRRPRGRQRVSRERRSAGRAAPVSRVASEHPAPAHHAPRTERQPVGRDRGDVRGRGRRGRPHRAGRHPRVRSDAPTDAVRPLRPRRRASRGGLSDRDRDVRRGAVAGVAGAEGVRRPVVRRRVERARGAAPLRISTRPPRAVGDGRPLAARLRRHGGEIGRGGVRRARLSRPAPLCRPAQRGRRPQCRTPRRRRARSSRRARRRHRGRGPPRPRCRCARPRDAVAAPARPLSRPPRGRRRAHRRGRRRRAAPGG